MAAADKKKFIRWRFAREQLRLDALEVGHECGRRARNAAILGFKTIQERWLERTEIHPVHFRRESIER
jgi:hypothetical protein